MIHFSDDRKPTKDQVIDLYRSVAWSSADKPDALHKGLLASHSLVTAWDTDALVGLGNAISDGHLVVYFPHMVVRPDYQGRGIGTELMTRMMGAVSRFPSAGLDRGRTRDRLLQEAGVRARWRDGAAVDLRRPRARLMQTYDGSCHCGRVRFRVTAALAPIVRCNCSICRKKGFLHLIVPPDRFELLAGREDLTLYEFNTKTAKHQFCRHCGIHPFYVPRSDPDKISVNVRCLEGVDPDGLTIDPFDGTHWEQAIGSASWQKR